MDNLETYRKYLDKQEEHRRVFDKFITSLEVIAVRLTRIKGSYVHERGAEPHFGNMLGFRHL